MYAAHLELAEPSVLATLGLCSGCSGDAWLVGILVATMTLCGRTYDHHVPHSNSTLLLLLLH